MTISENESVQRVQQALIAAGSSARILILNETARTAQDAASSIGCPLGAIVKSLVFRVDDQAVLALISGDRQCDVAALPTALEIVGECKRADADLVRASTGFAIGGVAPIGHPEKLPTAVDASLGRFDVIYAAAGHPHCVFPTTLVEIIRMTGGILTKNIAVI